MGFPQIPAGNGKHPVTLIVVSANDLNRSTEFYRAVFGWQPHPMSPELTAVTTPGGPNVALRSNIPDGFPGMVPYLAVPNLADALQQVVAKGGSVEKPPFTLPMVGKMARFKDPSGSIYGLNETPAGAPMPEIPIPFGENPKPPENSICLMEMYAKTDATTAGFFAELFGWGTLETMPSYLAFNPGAGIGGTFQSHTPALPAVAYIYTGDVDAKLRQVEAAGGKRTCDPMRAPGMGCFGYFQDASGTHMCLIGP